MAVSYRNSTPPPEVFRGNYGPALSQERADSPTRQLPGVECMYARALARSVEVEEPSKEIMTEWYDTRSSTRLSSRSVQSVYSEDKLLEATEFSEGRSYPTYDDVIGMAHEIDISDEVLCATTYNSQVKKLISAQDWNMLTNYAHFMANCDDYYSYDQNKINKWLRDSDPDLHHWLCRVSRAEGFTNQERNVLYVLLHHITASKIEEINRSQRLFNPLCVTALPPSTFSQSQRPSFFRQVSTTRGIEIEVETSHQEVDYTLLEKEQWSGNLEGDKHDKVKEKLIHLPAPAESLKEFERLGWKPDNNYAGLREALFQEVKYTKKVQHFFSSPNDWKNAKALRNLIEEAFSEVPEEIRKKCKEEGRSVAIEVKDFMNWLYEKDEHAYGLLLNAMDGRESAEFIGIIPWINYHLASSGFSFVSATASADIPVTTPAAMASGSAQPSETPAHGRGAKVKEKRTKKRKESEPYDSRRSPSRERDVTTETIKNRGRNYTTDFARAVYKKLKKIEKIDRCTEYQKQQAKLAVQIIHQMRITPDLKDIDLEGVL